MLGLWLWRFFFVAWSLALLVAYWRALAVRPTRPYRLSPASSLCRRFFWAFRSDWESQFSVEDVAALALFRTRVRYFLAIFLLAPGVLLCATAVLVVLIVSDFVRF